MSNSKFSESQIFSMLKEADCGNPIAEVLRNHGISSATFYKCRSKYCGLEASELNAVKGLGDRHADLFVPESLLDGFDRFWSSPSRDYNFFGGANSSMDSP